MDVIVKWRDGTQNTVSTKELLHLRGRRRTFKVGDHVKMLFSGKWYYGTVILVEDTFSSSSSDEPLSKLLKLDTDSDEDKPLSKLGLHFEPKDDSPLKKLIDWSDDSDLDPNFTISTLSSEESDDNSLNKKKE